MRDLWLAVRTYQQFKPRATGATPKITRLRHGAFSFKKSIWSTIDNTSILYCYKKEGDCAPIQAQ